MDIEHSRGHAAGTCTVCNCTYIHAAWTWTCSRDMENDMVLNIDIDIDIDFYWTREFGCNCAKVCNYVCRTSPLRCLCSPPSSMFVYMFVRLNVHGYEHIHDFVYIHTRVLVRFSRT
jgi:hypothetical protein